MNSGSIKTDLALPDMEAVRESASQACATLKALANEDRLLILCQLSQGARNVGELEALLDIRQPTLSQQLTVLREEGLVTTDRQGKYIYYSLASMEAMRIMQTLFELYCVQRAKD
ncbi:DNA-binding transcriptional regulator, ArsR family [Nitrosomonas sp. Nm51]|uniref:ArsR/SmtB family transcription factor n=1 Tax=Nitrosomonas sp. Nm51 TaxID=133720 RepID=UPI0008C2EF0B|nr:metalloregulator ArsR/SmtB family transcription factor [Nitrosomonas sp. Nm51]SER33795.1 DNA-binding transcriptional regulator, ArsR family [Nitrosomonas sp. Nm51]